MPKIPILKPREIIKIFERLGFVKDHQTGSHVILYHPITKKRATVPFHLKDLSRGFLSAILKQTNISRDEFLIKKVAKNFTKRRSCLLSLSQFFSRRKITGLFH